MSLLLEMLGLVLIAGALGVHGVELAALAVGLYLMFTARSMR